VQYLKVGESAQYIRSRDLERFTIEHHHLGVYIVSNRTMIFRGSRVIKGIDNVRSYIEGLC
jgi:hypothetical protein